MMKQEGEKKRKYTIMDAIKSMIGLKISDDNKKEPVYINTGIYGVTYIANSSQ